MGGVAEGAGVERLYLELMVVSQFHYVHVVCPVLVVCVGSRGGQSGKAKGDCLFY